MTEGSIIIRDRYHLVSEIGRGGIGVVYKGRDVLLERDVAIKVLEDSGLGIEGHARLLNEARAVAQLDHANITTIHDAGEGNDYSYIVMQYIEGLSLYEQPPQTIEKPIPQSAKNNIDLWSG